MSGIAWIIGGIPATPENLANAYIAPVAKPRDQVTMNVPLKPWDHPISFHRTLAFHIHGSTRVARNNNGIAETEDDAMRFDLPAVNYEEAGK